MTVSVQVPRFRYTPTVVEVDGTNDRFIFRETVAVDLTAIIERGIYTLAKLGIKVKEALEVIGASVYTVTYDPTTSKFTITSDGAGGGGVLELDVGGVADDALALLLGFSSDKSGALTYTSDVITPSTKDFDGTRRIRRPRPVREGIKGEREADSGAFFTVLRGHRENYRFTLEFETVATALGFYDFLMEAAEGGSPITFFPDLTNTFNRMTVRVMGASQPIPEMTDRGLYRHYVLTFDLRPKRPAVDGDTITMRDLLDRGPSGVEPAAVDEDFHFWAGDMTTVNDRPTNFAFANSGASTSVWDNRQTVMATGTVSAIGWQASAAGGTMDVEVNGSFAESFTVSGTSGTATLSTAVAAGDEVSLKYSAGTAPGESNWTMIVDQTVGGSSWRWGASFDTISFRALTWGFPSRSDQVTLDFKTQSTMPIAGNIIAFSWNTRAGDATTDIAIEKNGSVVTTIDLTGLTGRVAVSIAFVAGDEFSLKYTAGTAPLNGIYQLQVDYTGIMYAFGADLSIAGDLAIPYGDHLSTKETSSGVRTKITIPRRSMLSDISWETELGSATTVMDIKRNGSVVESVTLDGAVGQQSGLTAVVFEVGDEVEVAYSGTGTAPRDGIYALRMLTP